METLERYCTYEIDATTGKYKIKQVYEYPKTSAEMKIHRGIYQYLTPLILDRVINADNDSKKSFYTSLDIAKEVCMFNENYSVMKYQQDAVVNDIQIPRSTVFEFFMNTDNRMDDYIRRCIKYLENMNCVIYNEVHIVKTADKTAVVNGDEVLIEDAGDKHKASDDEMKLYTDLVNLASIEAGVKTNAEKWYGKTSTIYKKELSKLLGENNIEFVIRGFELWRVNKNRCEEILETFKDKTILQRKKEIGAVFKIMMDNNAKNREPNRLAFDSRYIENFTSLTDITLPYGAEDILPRLPSAKTYEAKMQEKAGKMRIRYEKRIKSS